MKVAVANYQLVSKVKSSKFNVDHLNRYELCFLIGQDCFQFSVFDTKSSSCLLLEDYHFHSSPSDETFRSALTALFENHHLLNAGFWKSVKLVFRNGKYAFIPTPLFDKNVIGDYLSLNNRLNARIDQPQYYRHDQINMANVFVAKKDLVQWFQSVYPNLNLHIVHHSSAIIEGIQRQEGKTRSRSMSLFVKDQELDIMVSSIDQFEYFNRFHFPNDNAMIKYVLMVMKEHDLDPNLCQVQLWGNLNPKSSKFEILYRYIRNISFGSRPSRLNFTFEFDEIEDHRYFDLLSSFYCQ